MNIFFHNKAYFTDGIFKIFEYFPSLDTLSFEINNTCNPLILWVFPVIIINEEKQAWIKHTYEYCKYKNYDNALPKIKNIHENIFSFEMFLNHLKNEVPYFDDSMFISKLHQNLMSQTQSPWFTFNRNKLNQDILDFCEENTYAFYEKIKVQKSVSSNLSIICDFDLKEEEKKPIKI